MSRLFSKRLHLAPLLAAKQPPRCRFPARSLTASANVFARIPPNGVENRKASSNARAEKLLRTRDEGCLIDRVSKLEDCADNSDERWIALAKNFATISPDIRKGLGDMSSKMEAGFAELISDIARLTVDMGKMRRDVRKMRRDSGEMHREMGKMHRGMEDMDWDSWSEPESE